MKARVRKRAMMHAYIANVSVFLGFFNFEGV